MSANQLLVIVDSRDLDSALKQARAAHQAAVDGLAEAHSGIDAAAAQSKLVESTHRRMEDLHRTRSISDHETRVTRLLTGSGLWFCPRPPWTLLYRC